MQTHRHLPIKVKTMKKRAQARFWAYAGIITETKEEPEIKHLTPPHQT